MIEGISHEVLCRYVTTRQKIDTELQIIYSLSHLLASFGENAADANLELDLDALGQVHQIINTGVLNISEMLDDFIYLVEAKEHIK